MKPVVIAAAIGLALTGAAFAQGAGAAGPVSEIRGGIYAHSVDQQAPDGGPFDFSRLDDANVEVLFAPLPTAEWFPGLVRPNLGATLNFGGLESQVYGGLSWKLPIASTPLFVEAGFGGALNNGAISGAVPPARDLGCNLLFHEQLSVGYDITPNLDVMFTAEHSSSANLCSPNRGLSNAGIRIGWKF